MDFSVEIVALVFDPRNLDSEEDDLLRMTASVATDPLQIGLFSFGDFEFNKTWSASEEDLPGKRRRLSEDFCMIVESLCGSICLRPDVRFEGGLRANIILDLQLLNAAAIAPPEGNTICSIAEMFGLDQPIQ